MQLYNLLIPNAMRKMKLYLILSLLFYGSGAMPGLMAQKLALSHPLSAQAEENQDQRQVSIIEALNELSQTYDVFFTYNTSRLKAYRVSTEYRQAKDVKGSLKKLLKKTNFEFKERGKNNFVIIEKTNQRLSRSYSNLPLLNPLVPVRPEQMTAVEKTITGTVTDLSTGESLPGVNILVKGTTIGTITDVEGNYRLTAPDDAETLVFSSVGYTSEEVAIDNRTIINLKMSPDIQSLNEVVVIGYGTQKKEDVTGSIASIQGQELEKQGPRINFTQALQGMAPGLNITQSGNDAGSDNVGILIRGQNSILANNGPLIILDGVPYQGGLNLIDQSTIESVQVLKDASSAAIYGARGANGVIIITTKAGTAGKPVFTYDGSYGVKQIYNLPDLLTGPEHWDFGVERYGEDAISNNYPTRAENYNNGVSTNWLDEATRTGAQTKHAISISGGAERIDYFVSGQYIGVKGISLGDEYENISGRVNLTLHPTDWLEIGTRSQYAFQDNSGEEVNFGGGFNGAFWLNPLISPYDENGDVALFPWPEVPNYNNPLSALEAVNQSYTRSIFTNNYLQVDLPIEGLSYKLNTGVTHSARFMDTFWGENTIQGRINRGETESEDRKDNNWLVENLLFYKKIIGPHTFDLTALYSAQKDTREESKMTARGFPTEALRWYQPGSAELVEPERTYRQRTYLSQMGRLFYSYQDKYLLTATVRRDGFSAFGRDTKFGIFPSVALGWNVSSESFLANVDNLSLLKLRLSYGRNGNQAVDAYSTLATVEQYDYLTGVNGDQQAPGYLPNELENAGLGWETTRSLNLGLDFGWYNNRISGSIDVYQSNTEDLLLNRRISQVNGVTTITSNIGEVENRGVELMLTTANVVNQNFRWTTTLNFARNQNEIVELYGNGEDDLNNQWFIGKSIDVNFAFQYDGVWQTEDNISESTQPDALPGDVKVKDANGDGEITEADRTFIGQENPNFTFGISNSLRYRNFSLDFMVSGRQGITRLNPLWDTDLVYLDAIRNTINQNWWSETNPTNDYPANRDGANPFNVRFYKDASYVRVNSVNLGYDFSPMLGDDIGIQNLQLVLSLINPLTFTKWNGLDPEYNDQRAAPLDRVYSVGINVRF